MAPADEEKVSNITEVCRIPREEALRVLDACHMDETMAIERIISGNGLSTWSEVSKKKKPPASQNRPSNRTAHQSHSGEREFERRGDRRDRERSQSRSDPTAPYANGNRRHGGRHFTNHHSVRSRDAGGYGPHSGRKRVPYSNQNNTSVASVSEQQQEKSQRNPLDNTTSLSLGDDIQSWGPIGIELNPDEIQNNEGFNVPNVPNGPSALHAPNVSNVPNVSDVPNIPNAWSNANGPDKWRESSLNDGKPPQSTDQTIVDSTKAWGLRDSSSDLKESVSNDIEKSETASQKLEPPKKPVPLPTRNVKRTFNYAAAAAVGTSHEKPAPPVFPERKTQTALERVSSAVERVVPGPSEHLVSAVSAISARTIPVPSDRMEPSVSEVVSPPVVLPPVEVDNVTNESTSETRTGDAGETRQPVTVMKRPSRTLSEDELKLESSTERRPISGQNGLSVEIEEIKGDSETTSTPSATQSSTPTQLQNETHLNTPPSIPTSAWTSHPSISDSKERKHLDDSSTAVAVASAAVTGNEASAGDSLSLQFGSFGLGALDVNWSAPDKKSSEPVSSPMVQQESSGQPTPAMNTTGNAPSLPKASSTPNSATVTSNIGSKPVTSNMESNSGLVPVQADIRPNHPTSSSLPLPSGSSGGNGSGMFPMLAVGPGGSFAPANYGAPYLVPPLHGYSHTLGSYDNGSDLGSSRGPNLAPGSLPLYDPANLPPMASGNGKYGAIPGLGDMSGLAGVQSGVSKDGLHVNGGDMEKGNSLGTSGLGTGMDALAGPYMMPGYPSMQYPMYTFPTGPYGPPGMAPPGPSPFPYAAAGQVSSQGGRGAFGFEDGNVGLGPNNRTGNGLGESMYTPGGYLNNAMSHGNQKNSSDSTYKSVRGNGGGLSGMGMGGGMMPGIGYGDYGGPMGGVGNGVGSNVGGPGGWSSRQGNGVRSDGSSAMMSNGSMSASAGNAGSQASGGYGDGPGAATGGYWTAQPTGYYP